MTRIKIDKKVPMPAVRSGAGGWNKLYPFDSMKVGDSFFLEEKGAVASSAGSYARCHPGVKFSVRKDGDGYRCWRIK